MTTLRRGSWPSPTTQDAHDDGDVSWCYDQGCTAFDWYQDSVKVNETRTWCDSAVTITRALVAGATSFQSFVHDAQERLAKVVCWSLIIFQASIDASHRHSNTAARTSWRSAITSPWMRPHTGGSRQDTHGTPVPIMMERPWVAHSHTA